MFCYNINTLENLLLVQFFTSKSSELEQSGSIVKIEAQMCLVFRSLGKKYSKR